MDGLSAASGVLAVVSLAGQTLQGLHFLDGFLGDLLNAPIYVRLLKREIDILKVIIQVVVEYDAIASSPEETALLKLGPSIEVCNFWVMKLEDSIKSLDQGPSNRRITQHWSRLTFALKKPKIEEYITRLSGARMTLIQAQMAMEG